MDLRALVDDLAATEHGLVMVMGKGGVGKTTIAAAVAVALAESGKAVNLTTTDPAQHLLETLSGERPEPQGQSHRSQGGSETVPGADAGSGEEHEIA